MLWVSHLCIRLKAFENTWRKCTHQRKAFENMKHPKPFDPPSWGDPYESDGDLLLRIMILYFHSFCVSVGSIFPSHRPPDTVFKITFWLGYFNSCLNPIIYPCFSQEFKKAFQNVLRGHCLSRTHRTWSPPASVRDPMHGPKSAQGFPSTSTDSRKHTNASLVTNKSLYTAHSNSALDAPETSLTTKVHQVSICKMDGEAVWNAFERI